MPFTGKPPQPGTLLPPPFLSSAPHLGPLNKAAPASVALAPAPLADTPNPSVWSCRPSSGSQILSPPVLATCLACSQVRATWRGLLLTPRVLFSDASPWHSPPGAGPRPTPQRPPNQTPRT
jgi:hypothetical protein